MKPTRRDPNNELSLQALGCLGAAKTLRLTRASWIRDAVDAYGWVGPLISGIEQDHWPAELKDRLRVNAREISKAVEDAYTIWQKSGRRAETLRKIAATYRVDGSRY